MLRLMTLSALFVSTSPFFFGTGGGCNCAPACPPPACAPPPAPACPPQPSCGGGGGYVQAPPPPPPPPPAPPIILPSYAIGGGGSYNPLQAPLPQQSQQIFPQQPILPQSPVYNAPQGEQPSFPVQQGGSYDQGVANAPNFQQGPQTQEIQPIAPQPPQPQPVGGNYQVPQQPDQTIYQPQAGYQQQVEYQQQAVPGATYQQPAGAGSQSIPMSAAQRDPARQELVNTLQHEAAEAAAAGSKNEEVVEEQDTALEKSGVGMTTVEPAELDTSTVADVVEEKVVDIANLKLTDDPLCNSEELRKLMLDNMDNNLNSSKRLIQLAAEAQFGGRFDVICANGDFSYVTNTELFCQETKGDVSCYTYRQI